MGNSFDRELGIGADITRRDFLNASLIGAGAALLEAAAPSRLLAQARPFDGPSGIGDYARSNGNTEAVLRVGHDLRDGKYAALLKNPIDTGESYDLVVVGGGISGLAAAYEFKQHKTPKQTCLILENHPIFGGEAKENEFMVNGQRLVGPQGSNGTIVPDPPVRLPYDLDGDYYHMNSALYDFYTELGMPRKYQFQRWDPSLKTLQFARDNYEFYIWEDRSPSLGYFFDSHGWVRDIWANDLQGTPYSAQVKKDFLAWRSAAKRYYPGADFPKWLDGMTYRDYIEKAMGLSPEVTRYADPILASGIGPCCDAISAYAAYRLGMPGFGGFGRGEGLFGNPMDQSRVFTFPGGNSGVARYFVKGLIPASFAGGNTLAEVINGRVNFKALDEPQSAVRMHLGSTAIAVQHEAGSPNPRAVEVNYVKDGKVYRLRACAVIMAGGSWITRHAVLDLPPEYAAAYRQFYRSPMLVVNVALTNWRFLYKLGITACRWFRGFGFTCNIRQPMLVGDYQPPLHPDKPIVLTFYVPFYYPGFSTEEQGSKGRTELLGTTYLEYERAIRKQMVKLFSSGGFDPRSDIAGIILNRWGHAYVDAQPGFYFPKDGGPAPRDVIRKRYGRISFAHSELIGTQHWRGAAAEGRRAARQAFEVL
jgi:spermidine dehydrogenase